MSDTSRQPVTPAQNGRPWYAKVVSEHWGPLLLMGLFGGAFLYGVFLAFNQMFGLMSNQSERHAAQIDRLITVIIEEVVAEQKRIATVVDQNSKLLEAEVATLRSLEPKVLRTNELTQDVVNNQKALVPIVDRLLTRLGVEPPARRFSQPQTTPPGRDRQPLGDQP